MALNTPIKVSRPKRTFDGVGSHETTGVTQTIFADVELHSFEPRMIVRAEEDVRIGDLVAVPYG